MYIGNWLVLNPHPLHCDRLGQASAHNCSLTTDPNFSKILTAANLMRWKCTKHLRPQWS